MRVNVLGCAGSFPAAGRPGSGFLVEEGSTALLLDAGPGTFDRLAAAIAPERLDAVVISHLHPDHCSDFLALWHYLGYGPSTRHGLPVFFPAGAGARFAAFIGADDPSHRFFSVFDVRTVGEGGEAEIGEVALRFAETAHSVPTIATRVEGRGPALVYSGDTGPGGGFPALGRDAGLMIAEATYQGDRDPTAYPFHLTAAEAGAVAREAGARRLMLSHLPPTLDPRRSIAEAESTFDRPVELAVPGMTVGV